MNKAALHLLLIVALLSTISAKTFGQKIFEKEYILSIMHKVNKYQLAYPWTLENDCNWIKLIGLILETQLSINFKFGIYQSDVSRNITNEYLKKNPIWKN